MPMIIELYAADNYTGEKEKKPTELQNFLFCNK